QVRARDQPREIVLNAQRRRNQHLDVEPERYCCGGRGRCGFDPGSTAAEIEQADIRIEAAGPIRALDGDLPAERRRFEVATDDEIRIDGRTDAFGVAQVHVLAADVDAEIGRQVAVE